MLRILVGAFVILWCASTLPAVEFLGLDLCKGGVKTSVTMPADSKLKLEKVSLGKHGGLVMLLAAEQGDILSLIDELMTGYTGTAGSGDEKMLQWSGGQLFGLASVKEGGRAVLAVSTSDECLAQEPTAAAAPLPQTTSTSEKSAPENRDEVLKGALQETMASRNAEFQLLGTIKHQAALDDWVDVMGVVVNGTDTSYKLASFDLSFFDAEDQLICVDTISVSVLKAWQQRPFRDSIRCPDYTPEAVASHQLHFAGGY